MFMLIDCITYRTDGSVMIGERVIGEGNREAMKGDYVSIVIADFNESNGKGSVYYYVNDEIHRIAFRVIPSVLYFSLSLSSQSYIQFISHDIYYDNVLKPDDDELRYLEYDELIERSFDATPRLSPSPSSLFHSPSQQPQGYNYPSLSFLLTKYNQGRTTDSPSSTDISSVESYNIPYGLCGIGEILHAILQQCSDAKDVIELLVSSGRISKVLLAENFGLDVSYCSSFTIPLRDVPCDKVNLV